MFKEIEIEVTAEHIKNGRRGSCCSCPIALAIVGKIKKIEINQVVALVTYDKVRVFANYPNEEAICGLPYECGRFIRFFDSQLTVHPFKFKLFVPENLIA